MVPLKMMRQRYMLAADQVFALSSVEVDSPIHAFVLGPSPLSFSHCNNSAASNNADTIALQGQRWALWRQKVEDCLWLASAFFILYYGDFRSNFFKLLANDVRVWRTPLHVGLGCLMLDSCLVMMFMATNMRGALHDQGRIQASGIIQIVTIIGSLAFILISVALWPIWNVLTVPMLFTLFMAFMVVAFYILPKLKFRLELASPSNLFASSSYENEKVSAS